jgi:uncharacterized radical SAM superfamily Fe-S cluster-containing enzyme
MGWLKPADFYPVPSVAIVSKAVGALKNRRYLRVHCTPALRNGNIPCSLTKAKQFPSRNGKR